MFEVGSLTEIDEMGRNRTSSSELIDVFEVSVKMLADGLIGSICVRVYGTYVDVLRCVTVKGVLAPGDKVSQAPPTTAASTRKLIPIAARLDSFSAEGSGRPLRIVRPTILVLKDRVMTHF